MPSVVEWVSVLSYASMVMVAGVIHLQIPHKLFMHIVALGFFVRGQFGMYRELMLDEYWPHALRYIQFFQEIVTINLVAVEICLSAAVREESISYLLIPTFFDLLAAVRTDCTAPRLTQFTNYISIAVLIFLSFIRGEELILLTGLAFFWIQANTNYNVESRFMNSIALTMATFYIIMTDSEPLENALDVAQNVQNAAQ